MPAFLLAEHGILGNTAKTTPASITRLNGRRAFARPLSDRSPPKDI
jgi:hypothetical protein